MELTYDPKVDAAYISLGDSKNQQVTETYSCEDLPRAVDGEIFLDFDGDGVLQGIEIF